MAPCFCSSSFSRVGFCPILGITYLFPDKRRFSKKFSPLRRETTSPTTINAGELSPACATFAARWSKSDTQVFWLGVVAWEITAAFVLPGIPAPFSLSAISPTLLSPIRNTQVSLLFAIAWKLRSASSSLRSWAVTTWKPSAFPRWVMGIPPYAGPARAELIPGTTSKGTPCSFKNSPSSPPRPNTYTSPPFKRTVFLCSMLFCTNSWLISPCFIVWLLLALPT